MAELKDKVVKGVAWSMAEKVGSMLLQMVVSIVVARLLAPHDFGVIAIMTFFTTVALVVVDSGFSQTLIRKAEPSNGDYKSVFLFNIAISLVLYAILTLSAPAIARFYELDEIAKIAPVLFLLLPINALCVIQNTLLTRQFRFDRLSQINFAASFVAGIVAIAMAVFGMGVWALVGQRLTMMVCRATLLWFSTAWYGSGKFSFGAIRAMAPFSLRLMFTDVVIAVYNNIAQLFIGKIYSAVDLGYFNQAQKLKELPVSSAMQSVQSVTYPALSRIKDDCDKFAEGYRKIIMLTAFVMFPVMVGLIAVANDMFSVLLGEKWMPTVPYFRIISLIGLFYPIATIALNVMKVHSDGRIIFRLEVAKRVIMTVVLIITIPISVKAIAWGLVAMSCIEAVINVAFSMRYTSLHFAKLVRAILIVASLTAIMYLSVVAIDLLTPEFAPIARLAVQIITGAIVYAVSAWLFRTEAMRETISALRRTLAK